VNNRRDLCVEVRGDETVRDGADRVDAPTVIGRPIHESASRLLERYESAPFDEFLAAEARRSAGDYVLVDPNPDGVDERMRYVTSPGHSVSYLSQTNEAVRLTTTYRRLFEALDSVATFDPEVLMHVLRTNVVTLPPYSGLFESVRKVPPAYVIEADDDGVERAFGYPDRAAAETAPDSLGTALDECAETLARYAEREDQRIVVMFSGGVDSTALLVGMRDHLEDPSRLTAVSCDWGPSSNSPERASAVGASLGIDVEVISADHEGWPPLDDAVIDGIREELSTHLVKPQAPHHALPAAYADPDDVVLSGQNMGLMIRAGHAGARQAVPSGFPSGDLVGHLLGSLPSPKALELFLMDFRFSDHYVDHRSLKELYRLLYRVLPDREVDFDPTLFGYLYGCLRSGSPNATANSYADSELTAARPEDVHRFLNEVRSDYSQATVDQFYYYWYSANAVDQQSTLPTPSGAYLSLPAMWGPVASWMRTNRRGVIDSLVPKRELYAYVRRRTGRHYHQLTGMSPDELRAQQSAGTTHNREGWRPVLVDQFADALDDEPRLLEFTPEETTDRARAAYEETRRTVADDTLSVDNLGRVYSAINLELMLRPTG
jgi:hypothetical protein